MLPLIAHPPFVSAEENSCRRRQNVVLGWGEIASDASTIQQVVQAELYSLEHSFLMHAIF
jgi:hypothetical protein